MPRRPKPILTDRFVAAIREPGIYRDGPGGIPGLLIRAGKAARTWELRSERPPKFTKTLGRWDDPFNPMKETAARAMAHGLLARHRRGEAIDDPSTDSITVDAAFALYQKDLERRGKSEESIKAVGYSLKRMSDKVRKKTLRALSDDPKIALADWERITDTVGAPSAMVAMGHLRSVYKYVRRRHDATLPERPPTIDVPIRPLTPVNAHAHAPEELPDWNKRRLALKNPILRECWLFGLLTGLRRANLRGLRWDMWDKERGVMRMIQKGKKPMLLVLSRPMVDCLNRAKEAGERLHREQARQWVFPSDKSKSGHLTVIGGGLDAPHALRRTFSSVGLDVEGVRDRDVDWLLGHSKKRDLPTLAPYDVDHARLAAFRAKQESLSARLMTLLG